MNARRVALGINSGNSIFIVAFVTLCGARQTHFSREGLGTNSLSQSLSVKPQGCLPGRLNPLRRSRASSPEGGAFCADRQMSKAPPSGELDATSGSGLRGFSLLKVGRSSLRSAALSQKAALQMPSPSTTPPVKMGYRNARRRSDIPKFKIILPLMMPRAQRRAF